MQLRESGLYDVFSFFNAREIFCLCLHDDLVLFDFLVLRKRNPLDNLLCVFLPPIILNGLNIFFSFYVFNIDFSLDRTHFYMSPIIVLIFILQDISVCLDILLSWYVFTVGFYPYGATAQHDTFCVQIQHYICTVSMILRITQ